MQSVITTKPGEDTISAMKEMCNQLFREWLVDLNFEEKKVWLWNASVELYKIRQRRNSACC